MRRIPLVNWNLSVGFSREQTPVSIPHDWAVTVPRKDGNRSGTDGGWFGEERLTYRCVLPEIGTHTWVWFDGVQGVCEVYVNHTLAEYHPYPYTGFLTDISPYLGEGENELEVRVSSLGQPASRWYTGCGLCRAVTLITGDGPFLRDVYVRTDAIRDDYAILRVEAQSEALLPGKAELELSLRDPNGKQVYAKIIDSAAIPSRVIHTFFVENPVLWSDENPALYTLKTVMRQNGQEDIREVNVGIRTVQVDHERGFLLNGKVIKLRGGCVHHDSGPLGACSYPDNEMRRVSLMKKAGFNAIRCAHNPPSSYLLDACDRLGVLVIDEAFDVWNMEKLPGDTHLHFDRFHRQTVTEMVTRDRSHPCVALWSTGNEIPEKTVPHRGYDMEQEIVDIIHSLDTRPITHAICIWALEEDQGGMPITRQDELNDVIGYNYAHQRVPLDHKNHPLRLMAFTETFPWKAAESWKAVEENDCVIGDFVWTAWDYMGEAGLGHYLYDVENTWGHRPWPWFAAWCGDFDLTGVRRPQSFLREIVWHLRKAPLIITEDPARYAQKGALSGWGFVPGREDYTWPGAEGKMMRARVFTLCDEVELFVNGKSVGKASPDENACALFEFAYEPGELKAVAGGEEAVLTTCGEPTHIEACDIYSGNELVYIPLTLRDSQGNLVTHRDLKVSVSAENARILSFASADPATEENYFDMTRTSFEGRLLVILKKNSGPIHLTVRAPQIEPLDLTIE